MCMFILTPPKPSVQDAYTKTESGKLSAGNLEIRKMNATLTLAQYKMYVVCAKTK